MDAKSEFDLPFDFRAISGSQRQKRVKKVDCIYYEWYVNRELAF